MREGRGKGCMMGELMNECSVYNTRGHNYERELNINYMRYMFCIIIRIKVTVICK